MDGDDLSRLVLQRWQVLDDLLRLSRQQLDASRDGRMSEVMTLLAAKQDPLAVLAAISGELQTAIADDPDQRHWNAVHARQACRQQHQECEHMLVELMQLESDSESALTVSRDEIANRISEGEGHRRATSAYSGNVRKAATGGNLDLTSN